jgi:CheY-like chemotaxis protein
MDRGPEQTAGRILVVEDDQTYLLFWERFLRKLGLPEEITLVVNPFEARDYLEKGECRLLISDINMSGLNGYDLARAACVRHPGIPIVLTTGYTAHLSHFDITGCPFHIIYKPFTDLEGLSKLILHLLAGDQSFDDLSEDSWSENEDYPLVTEWKL